MLPRIDPSHIWIPETPSPTGFVFLCPGRHEKVKPCTGATGRNLNAALKHLVKLRPAIFHSDDRYKYLITNSWPQIEFKAKTNRSRCDMHELVQKINLERLYKEIKDLNTVIACGEEARVAVQLCVEFLELKSRVVYASHTASAALDCPTTEEYPAVIQIWAQCVANQLPQ